MKRIFPVCALALWSALNSQTALAIVQHQPSLSAKPAVAAPPPVYVGEKVSLNFQAIEVRTVLQLLAEFTRFNLVASAVCEFSALHSASAQTGKILFMVFIR